MVGMSVKANFCCFSESSGRLFANRWNFQMPDLQKVANGAKDICGNLTT